MGEPAAELTSDPAYLAILYPKLFGPGEGSEPLMIEKPISALMKGPVYPTIDTWDIRMCGEKNSEVPEVVGNHSKCLRWWEITLSAWLRGSRYLE